MIDFTPSDHRFLRHVYIADSLEDANRAAMMLAGGNDVLSLWIEREKVLQGTLIIGGSVLQLYEADNRIFLVYRYRVYWIMHNYSGYALRTMYNRS